MDQRHTALLFQRAEGTPVSPISCVPGLEMESKNRLLPTQCGLEGLFRRNSVVFTPLFRGTTPGQTECPARRRIPPLTLPHEFRNYRFRVPSPQLLANKP